MNASGTSATAIDSPQKPTKTADLILRQVAAVMRRAPARPAAAPAPTAFLNDRVMLQISARDRTLTNSVMTKSTSPISTSASR